MLPHDPTGKAGAVKPMPDQVTIHTPKEDTDLMQFSTAKEVDIVPAIPAPIGAPLAAPIGVVPAPLAAPPMM